MEKRSCCCFGEDGTMNINMETGTEAAENAAAADAGADDAVCAALRCAKWYGCV